MNENENISLLNEGKVNKEFMLHEMGRNQNKYYRFLQGELKKYERAEEGKTA
ncbi:hypothetical protein [Lactonifactor longoviformis]|nr:hypothetical protein [Lactonifactor longoviformis]